MITINLRTIALYLLLFLLVWYGWPAWVWVAARLVEFPEVRWFGAGLLCGVAIRATWAWNAALALRRQQAIEKAEREFNQDKRRVV